MNLYLSQIKKWLEDTIGVPQQIVHTKGNDSIRYTDYASQSAPMHMTLIADADIKIESVSWNWRTGVGLNVDSPSSENGEKVHVVLWTEDELGMDERGCYIDSEGALNGVLVINNPEIKVTGGVIGEMLVIEDDPAIPRPLQVYIENARDAQIGGFTIPLPTTQEELQPFLDGAEIKDWDDMKICEVSSDITGLGDNLTAFVEQDTRPNMTLNELNYLAARIVGLGDDEVGVFTANIEANHNCEDVIGMINLTFEENLNCFDFYPMYDAEMYGDFLVNMRFQDEHAAAFHRLNKSDRPSDRALAKYILKLENSVDKELLAYATAKGENGVFVDSGYLSGNKNRMQKIYRSALDIPLKYTLTALAHIGREKWPSVMDEIKANRANPKPYVPPAPGKNKSKEDER